MELRQCDNDVRIVIMRLVILLHYIRSTLLFKFYVDIYTLIDVIKITEDISEIQYIWKSDT